MLRYFDCFCDFYYAKDFKVFIVKIVRRLVIMCFGLTIYQVVAYILTILREEDQYALRE